MDRIVSGKRHEEDLSFDVNLRPRHLKEYIGQSLLKENLGIGIAAAKKRDEALDHVLLYGPPGLGKTTLANILSVEMGVNLKTTSGPAIERPADIVSILTQMKNKEMLFIDEIHRLPRVVEEVLYPALEDRFVSWVIDKGLKARTMNLKLKQFTLIGATTRYGMLSAPLRDRFGSIHRLQYYDQEDMQLIIERSAKLLSINADIEGIKQIAIRSRGTPRVANRLLKRVRDYADVLGDGRISTKIASSALDKLQVDLVGLDVGDHMVLRAIIEKFNGGPVGVETIAAAINEESDTIVEVYEPFLLQSGLLDRTRRGRVATRRAYDHYGYEFPIGQNQPKMF